MKGYVKVYMKGDGKGRGRGKEKEKVRRRRGIGREYMKGYV